MSRTCSGWLRPTRIVLTLLVATAAAMVIACGGGGSKQAARALDPNQELHIRIAGDPGTFDPQLATVSEEISVVKQLYRGLFSYDEKLNVVPSIAMDVPTKENGGISDDGLTYTIKLRNDATWSDGQHVTANDFVYAFQRLFDPAAGAQGYYYDFYTAIAGAAAAASGDGSPQNVGVKALDDFTLQITLDHPQPTLPTLLALWPASPMRKDLIDQYGNAWTDPGKLVGNGPFVLDSYSPEQEVVLKANPLYQASDKSTLKKLVYRIIPDDGVALIAYENGEIDMTSIPSADAKRYEGNPEQLRYSQLETFALQYNNTAAPFDNPLVRQAISRGIDRNDFIAKVEQGVGTPATGWLPPGLPGYDASVGKDLGFDPNAAKELLRQAGYADGKGLPPVSLLIASDAQNQLAADFLQQQLKQNLGIDFKIDAVDENTYFDRYGAGDFQVAWSSWFADYADAENWLPKQFGTGAGFNVFGYSNPQVDDLFAKASVELDTAKRLAYYGQAHKLIIQDQAITPVFHPDRNYLVKSTVGGLKTTALDAEPGDWFVGDVQMFNTAAPPASGPDNN